jgi:SAM-dependent methyltransferase
MTALMSEATKQFYGTLYAQHGTSCRALSFSSADTQRVRFAALARVLPQDPRDGLSVLDVGCGFGDLYGFLREAGFSGVRYTGIDIMPEFIDHAAAAHPDGEFLAGDFLTLDLPRTRYDYVLSSGALNLVSERAPDHYAFIFAMIDRMFDAAGKGVAFNLLSSRGKRYFPHDPRFFYCDPEHVLGHCRAKEPASELDHDYLSYDFAVRARRTCRAN